MITELFGSHRAAAAPIFTHMNDTTILSCLQDYPGSRVWVDDPDRPTCAHVLMGGIAEGADGFSFVAGDSSAAAAEELVRMYPHCNRGGRTMVPENEQWAAVIEKVFPAAEHMTRYAMSKTEHHFDREVLGSMCGVLPDGFSVAPIDSVLYEKLRAQKWSRDLVVNFPDADSFLRLAVGFVCLHDGEPVGAASCYSVYNEGIEIEVDTREDHRRKGIARACASTLVLYALENGLYPSWDAANLMSVGLAESLGYVFANEYPAYWLEADCR